MASTSSHHHPILQENHHHQPKQAQAAMNQIATGRSRRSSSKNAQKKKKKPPQRGMGVEQLERLREQEEIKNHQHYSNNFTNNAVAHDPGVYNNSILNSSPVLHQFPKYCVSPNHNDFFVQQKVVNSGLVGSSTSTVQSVAFGDQYSQIGHSGFANSKLMTTTEKPKELYSSTSNLFSSSSNNNSCFSHHCRSCNKKKRVINGEETSMNMITQKEAFGTKPLLQYPYTKGVEIVAIHRKGSSFAYEEGSVVMEYDFFPEKNISSRINSSNTSSFLGNKMMMSTDNSPETSSAAAAAVANINGEGSSVTTISWAPDSITTPTSSIDLSLKLSY